MRYWIARLVSWLVARFLIDRQFEQMEKTPELKLLASGISARSNLWPAVRKAYLATNPVCECCGQATELDVHHIVPFHVDRSRELDPRNLITLCTESTRLGGLNCHLWIGHLGNWQNVDPKARELAAAIREGLDHAKS